MQETSPVHSDRDPASGNAPGGVAIALDRVALSLRGPSGNINILDRIDLEVLQGEALGVVGPSGSGKTSMLMLIAGLERASAGSVTVAGTELSALGEDALARFRRDRIGIVFQAFHLIPTMSAIENVAVPLEFAGRSDAFDRAEAALAEVGLGHRLTHFPGQLSGGEQQRLALARAFAPEPSLLLADEPTGNLDQATGTRIIELMFRLHSERGTTLMLITHDRALAGRCDRIVEIRDGRLSELEPA